MKSGKTLNELAAELTEQKATRRDFIAPTDQIRFDANSNQITLDHKIAFDMTRFEDFSIQDHTHRQIGSWAKIPKPYYDRMRNSSPDLLNQNVNHWLNESDDKRLVRTLGGNARAFLSERYRPFDNYEIAENALEALQEAECRIVSSEVTDKRFYLKAVSNRIEHEIKVGDVVQSGIVISNSEVGCGSLKVEPLIYRLVCSNGMISNDAAFRKNHLGSRLGNEKDLAFEFFSDETKAKSDEAVFMQIRDIVRATMTSEGFTKIVERFQNALEVKMADPFETIELVQDKYGVAEADGKGILQSLLRDTNNGDTLFGLVNAVTDYSKRIPDYDRATDMERLGGTILEAELVS